MKEVLLGASVSLLSIGAAAAKTISIDFAGTASSNPGLPGGGSGAPLGGSITYSAENASQVPFAPQF